MHLCLLKANLACEIGPCGTFKVHTERHTYITFFLTEKNIYVCNILCIYILCNRNFSTLLQKLNLEAKSLFTKKNHVLYHVLLKFWLEKILYDFYISLKNDGKSIFLVEIPLQKIVNIVG